MTAYETLSIVISCVAAMIAAFVWFGQRKLQRESNDMQRATADLARKQLEILLREEQGTNQARLSMDLVKDGKTFRFVVSNISDVKASNVDLELLVEKDSDNPIIESEYAQKFPAKAINPGSSISLIAALHLGSSTAYNARLKWINPDGSEMVEETFVAL